jgi:hypothetical protein
VQQVQLIPRKLWRTALSAVCALLVAALSASPAAAAVGAVPPTVKALTHARASQVYLDVEVPLFPVRENNELPATFSVSPAQAAWLAKHTRQMQALHRREHPLTYIVMWMPRSHYEVDFWFKKKAVAGVVIWRNGQVGPIYTGGEVLGDYARGHYSGEFDSPFAWVPFSIMFLVPLLLLRRRTWLERLDIAVVLSFGLSYYLFDTQHLEPAVWLCYPPLLYLLVRMLVRGFGWTRRRAVPRIPRPVDVALPTWVLVGGLLALVVGRIAITIAPKLIMDVGFASLIGAYKIVHGQPIYFASLGHPDTYGPITYLAYVPFELIWPLKSWLSYTPAVRAATITWDLLTIGGLLLLGRQIRGGGRDGWRLGLLMGWLWAACPFTVLGLAKNTNDGLTALFVVVLMLAWSAPVRRGAVLGLATAAKFFPAVLLPLVALRTRPGEQPAWRRVLVGFVVAAGASIAVFLPPGGVQEVWNHTMGYQLTRPDIFSPWALHPTLSPIKDAFTLLAVVLAVVVAVRPRGRRTTAQLAALAAALIIAVQLPALHWFYLYIVWFFPLVIVAVLASGAEGRVTEPVLEPCVDVAHTSDADPDADPDSDELPGPLVPVS